MRRDYFNQLAAQWDSLPAPPDAAGKVDRFVHAALRPADRRVLDLGCGTGILLPALLEAGRGIEHIVEVDLAEAMLAENARKLPSPRVHRVCADALALPFAEARFDAVLCFGVLPHLGPPERALESLLRPLRPGGVLAAGHLMGSEALNAFHASLEGPVRGDRLPPACALARLLHRFGATPSCVEEQPDWYLVVAEKRA